MICTILWALKYLLCHFDEAPRQPSSIFLACYLEGNHKHSFCFISILPDSIFIFCYHNNWHLTQAVIIIPDCCIVNTPRKAKFEIRLLAYLICYLQDICRLCINGILVLHFISEIHTTSYINFIPSKTYVPHRSTERTEKESASSPVHFYVPQLQHHVLFL